jgi:hypothetical protein
MLVWSHHNGRGRPAAMIDDGGVGESGLARRGAQVHGRRARRAPAAVVDDDGGQRNGSRSSTGAKVARAARGAGGVDRAARGVGRVDRAARGAGRRASGGVKATCGRHGVVRAVREVGEVA